MAVHKMKQRSTVCHYRHLPCFSFEKAGKRPGKRNNRLLRFLADLMLLSAIKDATFVRGEQSCLQWADIAIGDPHIVWEKSSEGTESDYLGIDGMYACRVKVEDDGQHGKFEVGVATMDGQNLSCRLPSRVAPQNQDILSTFQVAQSNTDKCKYYWMPISYDVNPLNPNAVIIGQVDEEPGSGSLIDVSICRYTTEDGKEHIGRMFRTGKLFGQCAIDTGDEELMIGGGYESLSAWLISDEHFDVDNITPMSDNEIEEHSTIYKQITDRVHTFLDVNDKNLISKITGHSFEQLMEALGDPKRFGINVIKDFLSTKRFIPHSLNLLGLSLLRSVLAERMINARRRMYGLDKHPDTIEWERDGVLLKDYDYYMQPENQEEFRSLLQMCAASDASLIPSSLTWLEKNVTADANDPQLQAHIDTFHSVVKMWVYQRGEVTIETGPLHFMRGSSQNTEAKLRWIYSVTIPPSLEVSSISHNTKITSMKNILNNFKFIFLNNNIVF